MTEQDHTYRAAINYDEPETKPPPRLEVGVLAWMRQNLFRSPFDIVVTILATLLAIAAIVSLLTWSTSQANWFVINNNIRRFTVDRLDLQFEWRVALTVLIAFFLVGMSLSRWARRSARMLAIVAGVVVILFAVLPFVIDTSVSPPSAFLAAGNVEIIDRAETISAQNELAFIAPANTVVSVQIGTAASADEESIASLDGFTDRASTTIANASASRLERAQRSREIAHLLAGDTLTDSQRVRLLTEVRTLTRTANLDEAGEARVDEIVAMLQTNLPEAAVTELTDEFATLLTPPEIIPTYSVNEVSVTVEILDGQTLEVIGAAVLTATSAPLEVTLPADGWYVIRKVVTEGEGVALLQTRGIDPLVVRDLGNNQFTYELITDSSFSVDETRPNIDGTDVPMVLLTDNQFRGDRTLSGFLRHFLAPFLRIVERALFPSILVVIWGYVVGYALAHRSGENSRFKSPVGQLTLLALALAPILPVLFYFGPVNGDLGFAPAAGIMAIVLKIGIFVAAVVLAWQLIEAMNRSNPGEEAQGDFTNLLMGMWGLFPPAMLYLAAGIPNLSGEDVGNFVGGLLWLGIIFFVGVALTNNSIGYGLMVLGGLLAVAQPHITSFIWNGEFINSDVLAQLAIWVTVAIVGLVAAVVGDNLRRNFDFEVRRLGFLGSLTLWVLAIVALPLLLDRFTTDAATRTQITDILPLVSYALWVIFMFFVGQVRLNTHWFGIGLILLSLQWLGASGLSGGFDLVLWAVFLSFGLLYMRERGENNRTHWQSRGTMLLGGMAAVWVVALALIPLLLRAGAEGGFITVPEGNLFPTSDTRKWGGLMLTMQLTVVSIIASFPIGLLLALGRRSSLPVVKWACVTYIELVRGVPLVTVLFMAQLLVPLVNPQLSTVDNVIRAMIGITLFSAAYLAENVRGGLQSIPPGQEEAAKALGLSNWQSTLFILLPQALRAVIPALVGQFISLFKDTSLVIIVGLIDLTGVAQSVVSQAEYIGRRRETFLFIAIIYFVFSYVMSYISRRVEESGAGAAMARRI